MLFEYNGTNNTPIKITINLLNFKEIIKIKNNIYILHLGEKLKDAIEVKISDTEEAEYFYNDLKNKIEKEMKKQGIDKIFFNEMLAKLQEYKPLLETLEQFEKFDIDNSLKEEIYKFLKEN